MRTLLPVVNASEVRLVLSVELFKNPTFIMRKSKKPDLMAQPCSALCSATGQDLAPVSCGHTLAEAMLSLALSFLWLICAKQNSSSFRYIYSTAGKRPTVVGVKWC